MTGHEQTSLEALARSRTAEARLVQRAQILLALCGGGSPTALARRLSVTRATVYAWITRFNESGLDALQDRPRTGRPPSYTTDQIAEVIAVARTRPEELGLSFGSWTLDRLQAYLNDSKAIAIKRSRISEILLQEGLRWHTQETTSGERASATLAKNGRHRTVSHQPAVGPRDSLPGQQWAEFSQKLLLPVGPPDGAPAGHGTLPRAEGMDYGGDRLQPTGSRRSPGSVPPGHR